VILPLPIFLGLFLGYGVYILYPVLESDRLMREAVQAVAYFQNEGKKPPSERSAGIRNNPRGFIKTGVIQRLEQAARLTPDDARIYVQLAWGTYQLWESSQQKARRELPIAEQALLYGEKATQLDPHGAAGYLVQYQIRMRYAKIVDDDAERIRKSHGDPVLINDREHTAREEYKLAAEKLEEYLPNDPHDAALQYMLWRAWHKAGNNEKSRTYATSALELDGLVTAPARKLEAEQRKQLESAISPPAPAVPPLGDGNSKERPGG
jgi:tetratricopeptide (TPR) repeat protein